MSVQVDELSPEAQQVIDNYTKQQQGQAGRYASLCAATGMLPWQAPTLQDHAILLKVQSLTILQHHHPPQQHQHCHNISFFIVFFLIIVVYTLFRFALKQCQMRSQCS